MEGFEAFLGVNLWTALFTLCNTIVLFLVLKKFLFKPVLKMIEDRQQEIDTMYADADHARESAGALQEEYRQKLATAEETGDRIVKEAVIRGQNREEEILRQANAQASAMIDKASASIAQEKKKAINDAKDEISDMAMAIAEKVVGRQISSDDHNDMIDAFIRDLGDGV